MRSLCPVKSRRRARSSSTSPHQPGTASDSATAGPTPQLRPHRMGSRLRLVSSPRAMRRQPPAAKSTLSFPPTRSCRPSARTHVPPALDRWWGLVQVSPSPPQLVLCGADRTPLSPVQRGVRAYRTAWDPIPQSLLAGRPIAGAAYLTAGLPPTSTFRKAERPAEVERGVSPAKRTRQRSLT